MKRLLLHQLLIVILLLLRRTMLRKLILPTRHSLREKLLLQIPTGRVAGFPTSLARCARLSYRCVVTVDFFSVQVVVVDGVGELVRAEFGVCPAGAWVGWRGTDVSIIVRAGFSFGDFLCR